MKPRSKSVWITPAALGRGVADVDGPRPRLLGPGGEEGLEPQRGEAHVHQLLEARLLLPVLAQELLGVVEIEPGHLGLDLGAQHDRRAGATPRPTRPASVGVAQRSLVDVEDVDERLGREQVQVPQERRHPPHRPTPRPRSSGPSSRIRCAAVDRLDRGLERRGRLAPLGPAWAAGCSTVCRSARISSVLTVSMSPAGSTRASTWIDVVVVEGPHHLAHGVGLADGRQELVPQPLPLRRAAHQAGDVHEGHRGRHHRRALVERGEPLEPVVGNGNHADVGLDGGERVVGRQHLVVGQRVEQRRLADVGQADDADRQAHGAAHPASRPARGGQGLEVGLRAGPGVRDDLGGAQAPEPGALARARRRG